MSKSVHFLAVVHLLNLPRLELLPHTSFPMIGFKNSNWFLINKIIPAAPSGRSKKHPGGRKMWNDPGLSQKEVVSVLPQIVPQVSQRRTSSHRACDGAHVLIVPEVFAYHIRSGVIREWIGHLDLTAKQTWMRTQYIQALKGQGYTPKWACDTLPKLALDTSEQTRGGALGLCWSPEYHWG